MRASKIADYFRPSLDVGGIYTVYGVEFWENCPWYYLCADGVEYPKPYPSVFFESVDKRLSTHWMMNSEVGRGYDSYVDCDKGMG